MCTVSMIVAVKLEFLCACCEEIESEVHAYYTVERWEKLNKKSAL